MGLIRDLKAAGITAAQIKALIGKSSTNDLGATGQIPPELRNGVFPVLITGPVSAQVGRYTCSVYLGQTNLNATGAIASTNLGTSTRAGIAWHIPEISSAGPVHLLSGGWQLGRFVGTNSSGLPIVLIGGLPIGIATPATTVGAASEGSETADTGTWSRASNGTPIDLWTVGRVVYNHSGDKKLYAYARKLTFDSCGLLIGVTAETRYEVDGAVACT